MPDSVSTIFDTTLTTYIV